MESAILTPKRTECGKSIRKAYENGEIKESRRNMTELEPRKGGISNTITTVQKDNLLIEQHDLPVVEMEVKQIGNMDADRENFENPQCDRVYDCSGLSPTINTCQGGQREPKILEVKKDYTKVHCGMCSHFMEDDCDLCGCNKYDGPKESQIAAMRGSNPNNPSDRTAGSPTEQRLEPNSQGICNTLTSVQKDNMVLEKCNKYRIRKLTPFECWRLMGFSDEDFHKAEAVNSNSQLYKQAGNSIVKNVLMAIFGQMISGKGNLYKEL